MTNIKRTTVDIDTLKTGDTVEINGQLETVNVNYLKRCPLTGTTYKGVPYRKGIVKVNFIVPTKDGYRIE